MILLYFSYLDAPKDENIFLITALYSDSDSSDSSKEVEKVIPSCRKYDKTSSLCLAGNHPLDDSLC